MIDLEKTLLQLPTFRALTEVEAELKAHGTPKNVDVNDPAQLAKQMERLAKRETLDQETAQTAFRLEVLSTDDSFLPLNHRLAVLAAYDPETIARQAALRQAVRTDLGFDTRHPRVQHGALAARTQRRRASVALYGAEGLSPHKPLHNAEQLAEAIDAAKAFAQEYAGQRIAMRAYEEIVLTGVMPQNGEGYLLAEPRLIDDTIQYAVPMIFDGIDQLAAGTAVSKEPTLFNYPHLLVETEQGMVAQPQINEIRQALGYTGLNLYRPFYLDHFTDSISGSEAGMAIMIHNASVKEYKRKQRLDTRRPQRRR